MKTKNIRIRNIARGTIPASEIEIAYRKAFNMDATSTIGFAPLIRKIVGREESPFFFADAYYKEADEELIRQILEEDKTDLEQYIEEDLDCDDFAFRLMGVFHQNLRTAAMPIFITWANTPAGHAILSYYYNGEVFIIEPQNDEIYSVPKNWTLILLCGLAG